jgi:hypothetical protein
VDLNFFADTPRSLQYLENQLLVVSRAGEAEANGEYRFAGIMNGKGYFEKPVATGRGRHVIYCCKLMRQDNMRWFLSLVADSEALPGGRSDVNLYYSSAFPDSPCLPHAQWDCMTDAFLTDTRIRIEAKKMDAFGRNWDRETRNVANVVSGGHIDNRSEPEVVLTSILEVAPLASEVDDVRGLAEREPEVDKHVDEDEDEEVEGDYSRKEVREDELYNGNDEENEEERDIVLLAETHSAPARTTDQQETGTVDDSQYHRRSRSRSRSRSTSTASSRSSRSDSRRDRSDSRRDRSDSRNRNRNRSPRDSRSRSRSRSRSQTPNRSRGNSRSPSATRRRPRVEDLAQTKRRAAEPTANMSTEAVRRMNPQEVKRSKTIFYLRQTRLNGDGPRECPLFNFNSKL